VVDIAGVGRRVITTTRVPILDDKGALQFILGVVNDVTGRRRAEDAERHNAEILTATITSMADAVLVVDQNGRVIVANPAAKRLFGDRPDVGSEDWAGATSSSWPTASRRFRRPIPLARAVRGESVDNLEIVVRPTGLPRART
jgi:PAS domain-containing protein